MADGSVAYQLGRLQEVREVIRTDLLKRINGRRHTRPWTGVRSSTPPYRQSLRR